MAINVQSDIVGPTQKAINNLKKERELNMRNKICKYCSTMLVLSKSTRCTCCGASTNV